MRRFGQLVIGVGVGVGLDFFVGRAHVQLVDLLIELLLFGAVQEHTVGDDDAERHETDAGAGREHERNDVELARHARHVYDKAQSIGLVEYAIFHAALNELGGEPFMN